MALRGALERPADVNGYQVGHTLTYWHIADGSRCDRCRVPVPDVSHVEDTI